jgi:hypothetical protein
MKRTRRARGTHKIRYSSIYYQIGRYRQKQIVRNLISNGYCVEYASISYNGVDIKAWKGEFRNKDNPDLVIECTNYRKTSYLSPQRALRYINNLMEFPKAQKKIYVSFWENIENTAFLFKTFNIEIKVMGKQQLK